jgi:hypothetical protein
MKAASIIVDAALALSETVLICIEVVGNSTNADLVLSPPALSPYE